jgi:hypothetical protein
MSGGCRGLACTLAVALAVGAGCSSTITLTTPPTEKDRAAHSGALPHARLGDFSGAPCFREEMHRYLATPGGLQLATDPGPFDLTLSGAVTRIEVHSNRGDKEAALAYFTAFVITAPIAAAMYGAKDWHADAAADGELTASDRTNAVVWKKSITVSIAENQRTMPSDDALKAAMTSAVCQKLAATLLNGLTEHLTAPR